MKSLLSLVDSENFFYLIIGLVLFCLSLGLSLEKYWNTKIECEAIKAGLVQEYSKEGSKVIWVRK